MVVLGYEFWLRSNIGYHIVVGMLVDRQEDEWLVVKNLPSMFKIFYITGYSIGRECGDFVAISVENFKGVYIRMIALHSYVFIICVAVLMCPIALV